VSKSRSRGKRQTVIRKTKKDATPAKGRKGEKAQSTKPTLFYEPNKRDLRVRKEVNQTKPAAQIKRITKHLNRRRGGGISTGSMVLKGNPTGRTATQHRKNTQFSTTAREHYLPHFQPDTKIFTAGAKKLAKAE